MYKTIVMNSSSKKFKQKIDEETGEITKEKVTEINEALEGETIEEKINRIVNNGEPVSDGAPLIFTERKDGVLPAYDIRTDRMEIALDAMDKVTRNRVAKREAKIVEMQKEKNNKVESSQGTTDTPTE